MVTDFRALNRETSRIGYPFPSADSIKEAMLPNSKVFVALDCVHGYHQVPVAEECTDLLAFITPLGKYKYLRLPMGFSSSSDNFLLLTDPLIKLK